MPSLAINLNYAQSKLQDPVYPDSGSVLTCVQPNAATTGPVNLSLYATLNYLSTNHYTKLQSEAQYVTITGTTNMQLVYETNPLFLFKSIGSVAIVPAANTIITLPIVSTATEAYLYGCKRLVDPGDALSATRTVTIVSSLGEPIIGFPAGVVLSANDATIIRAFKNTATAQYGWELV